MESFIGNHIEFIVDWGRFVAGGVGALALTLLGLLGRRNRHFLPRGVLPWAVAVPLLLLAVLSGLVFARISQIAPGARAILDRLDELTGREAPPLEYRLVRDDRIERLAELRGRVVLVNYWATWCAPCRAEMPDLDRLQRTHAVGDLTVLTISDESRGALLAHDDEFHFAVRSGYLAEFPWVEMGSERPVSFLVDREGVVREIFTGPWDFKHFEDRVARLL